MKKSLVTALIAGAAVLAGAIMLGPQRIALANQATGDEQLATELAELSVPGHNQLAAMTIEDGVTNYAGWGADNETEVEIGSVTKMLTAELLRHEIDNGAVKLETTLGELIDELADPVASVTLGRQPHWRAAPARGRRVYRKPGLFCIGYQPLRRHWA
ncbi:hypothetical protein [Corynebacterium propinquum]